MSRAIVIKSWFMHNNLSELIVKNNVSICTEKKDGFLYGVDDETVSLMWGDVIRETEKAVQVSADFWSTRSHIADLTVHKGWKVWIPKSVIIKGCGK